MAAYNLRMTVNAAGFTARFRKAMDSEVFTTPLLTKIGREQVAYAQETIAQKGRGKWAPLSPNTVAAKGHDMPLFVTGALGRSIKYRVIPGARVTVGTNNPIAPYHHFGTGLFGPKHRAYKIRPRNAAFLVFRTVSGLVITSEVIHPGVQIRRFLPTDAEAHQIAKQVTVEYIRKELGKQNAGR